MAAFNLVRAFIDGEYQKADVVRFWTLDVGKWCECDACKKHLEQYCPNMVMTYSSPTKDPGGLTFGGYSKGIVVTRDFVRSRARASRMDRHGCIVVRARAEGERCGPVRIGCIAAA